MLFGFFYGGKANNQNNEVNEILGKIKQDIEDSNERTNTIFTIESKIDRMSEKHASDISMISKLVDQKVQILSELEQLKYKFKSMKDEFD